VPPFRAPPALVRTNICLFLSLILSVSCALGAVLMQQWARRYLHMTQRPATPHRRAHIRAFLFDGLQRFDLIRAAQCIPVLLHAAVFLFFAGLVQFLFTVSRPLACAALAAVVLVVAAYALLTVLPMLSVRSPYLTPLS
ncbi:hypothetical protein BC834DRAFT_795348, partial [Gloeopeniophorella convolvens]